jgi:hypothetical protein
MKDSEGIKAAAKICRQTKAGIPCVKEIDQLKPCFA